MTATSKELDIERIAKMCHETNRIFCESIGDMSQKPWAEAEEWQRSAAFAGVKFAIENPDAPASHSHDDWMAQKTAAGWAYGPVKDSEKKQHPDLVPYDQLSTDARLKDYLFQAIVSAFVRAAQE